MTNTRLEKKELISQIKSKIAKSSSIVVVHYHNLRVVELQELRRLLKAQQCEMIVYKNTLFKLAVNESNIEMKKIFDGPNAYIFSYGDSIIPFKIVSQFIESHAKLKFKAGIFENQIISAKEALALSKLPSRQEALGMLAMSLIAPLQQLAIGLNLLITEQKIS